MVLIVGVVASTQIDRAYLLLKSSNKAKIQEAHNIFRAEYIKSLLDDSRKKSKIEALRGLIASSKKLGLPYEEYRKELFYLIGNQKISPSEATVEKRFKTPKINSKRLTKIILRRGYVEFYFDAPLSLSDIRFMQRKVGNFYQNIYQIKAKLVIGNRRYRLKSIDSMQVVRYSKDWIRIIFSDKEPVETKKVLKGSKLEIYVGDHAKKVVKLAKTSKNRTKVPTVLPVAKKVIVIDPGHGGYDSGAIGYERKKEKDIVLQIARKLYSILKTQGYKVYMTRRGDYFVSLRNRTRFANRVKANLFISIHANAAPNRQKAKVMQGLETFFLSPSRSERAKRVAALENRVDVKNMSYFSKQVYLDFLNREKTILSNKLAIDLQRNILYSVRKSYRLIDGGVRPGPFWVLVGAQMPAVLVEVGYITHPKESLKLSNPRYQRLIAEGIAAGIASYFRNNQR